jgi:bleomycin hydrolase
MKKILFFVFCSSWIFLSGQNSVNKELPNQFLPILPNKTITNKPGSAYKFSVTNNIETTPVKSQGMTGTCWSFSSLSFFESEIIRKGKQKGYNLSEMFVARLCYPLKAENYVRMHGKAQFGEGGEFHDAVFVLKNYGMVPEEVYNGNLKPGAEFNHHLLDSTLQQLVKGVAESNEVNLNWKNKLNEILDKELGKIPTEFIYEGKKYTPKSFAQELGINPDDYVFISSFNHHPWYSKFVIEIPDNWMWEQAHNIPLDEFMSVINNALQNGYGVGWAADVSESTFDFRSGLAVMPEKDFEDMEQNEKDAVFVSPVKEKKINQENRQYGFDNYETQDDHGMHMTGICRDQNNTAFYIVKNSWGKSNSCEGYFFASEAYVRSKTISIMVHKDAIPVEIRKKMNLK